MSASKWNEDFELPYGPYPVSDIHDYGEYILKKREAVDDNPSIKMYVNKIKNRITFKRKTGYFLKLLMPETIKYLEALKV